jgi:rfaE bifunctional protein kinase chain/domain
MVMKKIVLVSGNFNVIHPGHIRLLKFARECGNKLIVAVNSDRIAENKSMVPEDLRLDGVRSNSLVDESFIWDDSIANLIDKIKPDIVVKGKEHEDKINVEEESLRKHGGKLIFSSGESIFSSAELLRSEFLSRESIAINFPKEYISRHSIDSNSLINVIKNFSSINVCVVGDLIVDEYIDCNPLGMSQEDPTIVVTPVHTSKFIGGAGIVAAHAAGLGATVSYVTVSGDDETHQYAKSKLVEYGVGVKIIIDETRPTTLKQRYRSKGKSLLRVSHLHQDPISTELQNKIYAELKKQLVNCNLVIFSDFNYGCLPQALVDRIIREAKARKIMMVADSQSSSQVGNIGRFFGMDLVTPTEREARISTRNYADGLVILAEKMRSQCRAKNIILKMGEEGALIHTQTAKEEEIWHTDQIEALNRAPKDPAGAGDSMLTVASLGLASGANIWLSTYLASVAAAIQVGRVGNMPITSKELLGEITK